MVVRLKEREERRSKNADPVTTGSSLGLKDSQEKRFISIGSQLHAKTKSSIPQINSHFSSANFKLSDLFNKFHEEFESEDVKNLRK
jgi:hypothetical protein